MKRTIRLLAVVGGLLAVQAAMGQATPPAGSTGLCKDGTYSTAASKQGACRGHQGVKEWYAAAPAAAAKTTPAAPVPTTAPAPTAAPVTAAPATTTAQGLHRRRRRRQDRRRLGVVRGLVWVNTSSNVYHCYGTDFYGKTKAGSYMSEADAKAKGAHADHGKPCSK